MEEESSNEGWLLERNNLNEDALKTGHSDWEDVKNIDCKNVGFDTQEHH